jgi:serine/threonine-protein kinase RsbW
LKSIHNEFIIYGLHKYNQIIDSVISELSLQDNTDICFDIKLLLVEALTNAFKHGNEGDENKAIILRYSYCEGDISFEIEDMGKGFEKVVVPEAVSVLNLLDNCGRGLFIINSIADKIEFKNNIIIIKKRVCDKNLM